jgi:hypothetical protein
MANIGASRFLVQKYNGNGLYDAIFYAKLVSASVTIDGKEPANLYADNEIAESMGMFQGGTLTITLDDDRQGEIGERITRVFYNVTGNILRMDDGAGIPFCGVSFIIKKVVGGVIKWRLVKLYKVRFQYPDLDEQTQGESIEFRTLEFTAEIYRATEGSNAGDWCSMEDFDTEEDARRKASFPKA